MEQKKTSKSYSSEVRERAVGMVSAHLGQHASEWAALVSISAKIGCAAETLRAWVRQSQRDEGLRAGVTTAERDRLKAQGREVREPRQGEEDRKTIRGLDERSRPAGTRQSGGLY